MDVGTDPITMTEVGVITGERQVSTNIFMRVGGTISGIIGGEDNSGIISGYLNGILIAIGVHGKETGTGTVEDTPVTSVEDIPVEDTPVTSAEDIPVEENQLNKVVLNQAGKAPVVPIIREMKDDKKDRIEGKAAKCQIAA